MPQLLVESLGLPNVASFFGNVLYEGYKALIILRLAKVSSTIFAT
jgi:hypothetical protein